MVLEFILGKLGFTEGQEFQTQVSMKTDDGTTKIPDVIVHFPDKDGQRDVVIDSKVSLTAWDEYVNSDDENIPILTMALEVGFNSIAPFNRAFKSIEGVTPSEYRRRYLS